MCTANIMQGLQSPDNAQQRIGHNQARLSREGGFSLQPLMSPKAVRDAKLTMGREGARNMVEGTMRFNRAKQ
jgi:hypothetical protein